MASNVTTETIYVESNVTQGTACNGYQNFAQEIDSSFFPT